MFTHFWSGQQISLFDGARAKKLPNEFIALLTCQKWAYILCTIEMAIFPDFFRLTRPSCAFQVTTQGGHKKC